MHVDFYEPRLRPRRGTKAGVVVGQTCRRRPVVLWVDYPADDVDLGGGCKAGAVCGDVDKNAARAYQAKEPQLGAPWGAGPMLQATMFGDPLQVYVGVVLQRGGEAIGDVTHLEGWAKSRKSVAGGISLPPPKACSGAGRKCKDDQAEEPTRPRKEVRQDLKLEYFLKLVLDVFFVAVFGDRQLLDEQAAGGVEQLELAERQVLVGLQQVEVA